MHFRFFLSAFVLASAVAAPNPAGAQPKKGDEEATSEETDGAASTEESNDDDSAEAEAASATSSPSGGEKSADDAATAADEGAADTSPVEVKGETYHFVGARLRAIVVPSFIIELFGEGGTTVMGPSFGPEFAIRRDGFEYNFALSYTAYPMDLAPFKAPSDPPQAMELVESHVKVLYLTADFLWSHSFSPQVALLYGGGAGLGVVWGDLLRTEAYPDGDGGWELCRGEADPNPEYCSVNDNDPDHYDGYSEPSWASGGSKPIIMPWLALQMGLRFKPHRNFVARAEFGIGLGQVFFGIGADYGL